MLKTGVGYMNIRGLVVRLLRIDYWVIFTLQMMFMVVLKVREHSILKSFGLCFEKQHAFFLKFHELWLLFSLLSPLIDQSLLKI